jgi:hypothetical protein
MPAGAGTGGDNDGAEIGNEVGSSVAGDGSVVGINGIIDLWLCKMSNVRAAIYCSPSGRGRGRDSTVVTPQHVSTADRRGYVDPREDQPTPTERTNLTVPTEAAVDRAGDAMLKWLCFSAR